MLFANNNKNDNNPKEEETTHNHNVSSRTIKIMKSVESSLEELVCPISQELPIQPVHAADGKVYERIEIERWIQTKRDEGSVITSPSTRAEMDET